MERRCNTLMEKAIQIALSKLTPHDHGICVKILVAAQVPVETISRLIFLPHRRRTRDRRQDGAMATIISRARGILNCSNLQDAVDYLRLKRVPEHLMQRALQHTEHREA